MCDNTPQPYIFSEPHLADFLRKCGLSYIVADSRQIIWREFLRSHCKHSTKAQMALPHNVAWPFFLFLPWYGCHVPAAMICGRKRPLTLNLALLLRTMVLPDNVAPQLFPQIFLGLTRKSVAKNLWEVSPCYEAPISHESCQTTAAHNH